MTVAMARSMLRWVSSWSGRVAHLLCLPVRPRRLIGNTGPPGPAGANGSSVVTSSGAPTTGCTTGNTDVDLANGEVYTCTASVWVDSGSSIEGPAGPAGATGPAGPAGASGNTVLNGTGPPGSSAGNNGDFYIDTAADVLYGPKAGGSWPTPGVSLTGTPGATGPAGPAGPAGSQGPPGVGTAGQSGLDTTMVKATETLPPDYYGTEVATCPADHPYVLGGGGGFDELVTTGNGGPNITESVPEINGIVGGDSTSDEESNSNGWAVFAENLTGISDDLTAWAICAE